MEKVTIKELKRLSKRDLAHFVMTHEWIVDYDYICLNEYGAEDIYFKVEAWYGERYIDGYPKKTDARLLLEGDYKSNIAGITFDGNIVTLSGFHETYMISARPDDRVWVKIYITNGEEQVLLFDNQGRNMQVHF